MRLLLLGGAHRRGVVAPSRIHRHRAASAEMAFGIHIVCDQTRGSSHHLSLETMSSVYIFWRILWLSWASKDPSTTPFRI